jgi:hypothetical protein
LNTMIPSTTFYFNPLARWWLKKCYLSC